MKKKEEEDQGPIKEVFLYRLNPLLLLFLLVLLILLSTRSIKSQKQEVTWSCTCDTGVVPSKSSPSATTITNKQQQSQNKSWNYWKLVFSFFLSLSLSKWSDPEHHNLRSFHTWSYMHIRWDRNQHKGHIFNTVYSTHRSHEVEDRERERKKRRKIKRSMRRQRCMKWTPGLKVTHKYYHF